MGKEPQTDIQLTQESLIQRQIAFASGLFQADVTTHILLESLAEAAVVLDRTGVILLVNAQAERMFGYTRTELIGIAHDMILPMRFHTIHKKHMDDYFANPKIRPMGIGMDLIAAKKDGSEFPVEISLSYVKAENNFFVIAFISDISLRKKAEEALLARNEALDAFAHTLAHDIRNSITIINGFSTYVNETLEDISREELRDTIKTIIKTGNKVNHIIESLLLFSSISREHVPFTPVEMGPVVHAACDRLQDRITESGASLIIPQKFPLSLGFDSWIEEIWFNYIANAIKYGGNPPVIEIGFTERDNDYITFWVKDNGKGIRPEVQDTIFEMYQPRRDKTGGYGLGLSIVKRIAEKLNGTVGVKSNPHGGSVFSFSLPSVKRV